MNAQAESHTRLHGRWLFIARLAWSAVFITLTAMYAFGFLAVHETLATVCEAEPCSLRQQIRRTDAGEQIMHLAGPTVGYADRLRPDQVEALETLGLTLEQYGWLGALQLGLPALVLLLIAAGLFWWKSDDWMVLFASIMVATFPTHNTPLLFTLSGRQPAWEWVGNSVGVIALSCLLIFPLLFPTGRFVPRWTRWLALYDVAGAFIGSFLGSAILEVFGDVLGAALIGIIVLLPFGIGVYAQLYRYFRVARPAERQQFKWVVVGLVGAVVIQFAVSIPLNTLLTSPAFSADPARAFVLSAIPDTLWQISILLIPVCITISVLRYRLWDIDIIISRALVYSTLTAIIAGLYILVVGSLISIMQNQNDLAATAVALLIVATLVRPLRRALQNNVNRLLRFDPGRRDEAQDALQSFSEPPAEIQEENVQIQEITEVDSSPHTRLHGRWLLMARLAWVAIAILAVIMHIAAAPVAFNQLRLGCGLDPCDVPFQTATASETSSALEEQASLKGAWDHTITEAAFRLLILSVALFIFWRRSDDWMAHIASIMLVTIFVVFSPSPVMLANVQPLWHWPRALLWAIGLASTVGLFYLFPDGRFVPRWTRGLAITFVAIIGALAAAGAPFLAGFPIFVVALATGAGFQIYRYRRVSGPLQRQQTKWVVLGIIGMVLPILVFFLVAFLNPSLNPLLTTEPISPQSEAIFGMMILLCIIIPFCFLPVTLAFSLLRYRLWDVDILINRTLVYGVLTTSVAGLYVLVVAGFGILFQMQNNLPAIIIAMLFIIFLFQPLRRRLQDIVNRFVPNVIIREAIPPPILQLKQAQKPAIPDNAPNTALRGHWLILARLAWAAVFITLTVMYAFGFLAVRETLSTVCKEEPCTLIQQIRHTEAGEQVMNWQGPPSGFADPLRPDQIAALERLGLTLDQYSWLGSLQMGIPVLVYLLIAAGLFWRKSDDWMVLLVSTMIATFPLGLWPMPYTLAVRQPIWQWVHTPANFVALSSFFIFPLIFPTGRFVPRWTRWKIFFDLAFAVIVTLWGNSILIRPPGAEDLEYLYIVLLLSINAYALSYRYFRVASPVERQQIKWVVAGLLGFVTIAVPLDPLAVSQAANTDLARGLVMSGILDTLFQVIALFIPISIAISVLRYRLWDIDIVINRTLVYGALTASVVALYVLIVGWSSIGLQTQDNLAGSVFAILVIAFLFRPLRQRLQRIADRFVPAPQTALPMKQHKHQITIPESQRAADTMLRGRWLLIVRLAWAAVFLTLIAMYAFGFLAVREALSTVCEEETCTLRQGWPGPPIGYADPLHPDQVETLETLRLTLNQYGWLGALQMGLPLLVYLLIAAGLFWKKSDDWMVLFASLMVATIPIANVPLPFVLAVRQPSWQWVNDAAGLVSLSLFLIFPLIFPNGRFVPRWTRWMAFFDIAFAVIATLFGNSISGNPVAENLVVAYLLTAFGTGVYAQLYRYFRMASPVERQQIKWVIVGLAGFISIAFAVLLPLDALLTSRAADLDPARALLLSIIPDTLFQVILLFIPVSIALSVLRYRLWDIDILINRTLVYGALTGIVVSAFVILVGFLSLLFQSSGNSIIAIIATGLVALLFNPLRQRLQRAVNRVMYGERDEPYAALSRLGRRLESTLAPESVLPTVVTTVRDVLRLPYVAIYLQQNSHGYKIVAESASPLLRIENGRIRVPGMEREGRCIPLIHQGETVGYIVLGPRAPNEAFSTTDLRLLEDLAPQVGVAVHAVRLTADLQRSREQLVLAREEERRRLRRDLHDGLGPQLAGLALKLETLRNRLRDDPLADSLLADLAKGTQDATADIRHLVYELRPPTLDELGLVSALRESATQYSQQGGNGVHITIDAPELLPPLPAAVEVAVYRIVQEALTNVIRHADARNCYVRLRLDESAGLLCMEVQDDGKGLSMKRRAGVGLNSMRERAEELGGTFTVAPVPAGGTRLTAQLPCRVNDRNTSAASKKE